MPTSAPTLILQALLNPLEPYSDSRTHGYQGPSRHVRLSRVTPAGGGAISKSEDGTRCAVTGKESLRILRISAPGETHKGEHKSAVGEGGHRIDASRNFWDASGLKIDSASTDVAWGYGIFNNKILTSARNGELIMWDLNKSGNTKYERRSKDHIRSINKLSVSHIVHHYCITGSADGHLRVWDLRDMNKSIMRVHHPTSVRSLVFSPSAWNPLQAIVGLDNGSIYRWDLKMGQRGQLDRLHVAHTASVTALDWCPAGGISLTTSSTAPVATREESSSGGLGWIVSGGLDRTVKVWDLTAPGSNVHIPHKPTYILHPPFPVRRLAWRPGYECELAVVSNSEYATPSADMLQTSGGSSSGLLTRVGSSIGLDAFMRGPLGLDSSRDKLGVPTIGDLNSTSLPGDSIEIWDIRRPWIGKWSITGSGVEGGVSDIEFHGSHALWTQHPSGAFSQFDLREATKPIDAIPRMTATWEATGSMTFVVDRKERFEIPYDDVKPISRPAAEARKPGLKALGDVTAQLTTQVIGTYVHHFSDNVLKTFTTLARGYVFEGRSRKDICVHNADVALSAGDESAAQVWLLLGASLADYLPSLPPISSAPLPPNSSKNPVSPPPSTSQLSEYTFPPALSSKPTPTESPPLHKISPSRRSTGGSMSRMPSSSATRRLTPTSSTSSSPRHIPVSLPPVTPRRASFFGRRESMDAGSLRSAMLRRPSLSVTPGGSISGLSHSSSPGDRNTPSLRHVGEGVLDSDSDGSDQADDLGDETAGVNSSDDDVAPKPMISPVVVTPGTGSALRAASATPSPLSRVAGKQTWTDEEEEGRIRRRDNDEDDDDDASSPSPQSTSDADSDSEGSNSPRKLPRQRSRSGSHSGKIMKRLSTGRINKSRSRSSTVASLAAPTRPSLTHQESHSSIKTVTAVESSHQQVEPPRAEVDNRGHSQPHQVDFRPGHNRQKSVPLSEFMHNSSAKNFSMQEYDQDDEDEMNEDTQTERRIEVIRAEDRRFRESTLSALKKALEDYAFEGDVQMCTMLTLVASKELGVSKFRLTRFLDSYIDILSRLRLHTCAAYLRKYCEIEDVQKQTLLETIIYTSCGKCRKPLKLPIGAAKTNEMKRGRFAYCATCQAPCVRCSICHLPVRTMLFQCSVCHHGGHQACYQEFYANYYPAVDLPTSFLPNAYDSRGRQSTRPPPSVSSAVDDDSMSTTSMQSSIIETPILQSPVQSSQSTKLHGRPCAAGCGHFCWATNFQEEL